MLLSCRIPEAQRMELDRIWTVKGLRAHGRTQRGRGEMIALGSRLLTFRAGVVVDVIQPAPWSNAVDALVSTRSGTGTAATVSH